MSRTLTPDEVFAHQESEVARLEHELEIAKAVLRGMQAMRSTPAAVPSNASLSDDWRDNDLRSLLPRPNKTNGRQKGAISHQWRDALNFLWINYPDGFTEHSAAAAANAAGLPNVRAKDALDRMKAYVPLKYVDLLSDGRFRVTDLAVQRYAFKSAPKNEASKVETQEAS